MSRECNWYSALFVALCMLSPTASRSDPSKSFTVQFTTAPHIGGPVIKVLFSNGYSGRFLLDTGTTRAVVTDEVAARVHLVPYPSRTDDGKPFLMGGVPAKEIVARDVKIGSFTATNFTFIVMKRSDMPYAVDGIIGINFFAEFSTLLDYGTHIATFWYHDSPTSDERLAHGLSGAVALPLAKDPSPYFSVRARYNGSKEENLLLSTAVAETRISWNLAQALKLRPLSDSGRQRTAEGSIAYSEAILNRLELGDLVLKSPTILYVTDLGSVKKLLYPPCIASDVLSHCRVLIDAPNHVCYIKPLDNIPSGKSPEAGKTVIDMAAISAAIIPAFTAAFSKDALSNFPVIDVKLGDRYVGKFLIHSGTSVSMVTDSVADILRLKPFPTPTADGKPLTLLGQPTRCVTIPGVTIGNQDLGDQLFILINHKDLWIDVDGILGCNFLSVFSTLLDFGGRTVTFWYNASPTATELARRGMKDSVIVPGSLNMPYSFMVHARFNNTIEDDVVIDTGAEQSQITQGNAKKLKLHASNTEERARVFGGTTAINSAVIQQFEIGGILVKDLTVQYTAEPGPKTVKQCVGMDVLSRYKVLIDAPNKLIYLKSLD